jgi:hypothetical protein
MSELASVKLGKQRDKQIQELIETSGPFCRDQVQQLIFPRHKGTQKCNQRLNRLFSLGKVKRIRYGSSEQYIYYTGRWNQKAEHALMVNWIYVSLLAQMKSWFKLKTFSREYTCQWDDNRLVADALLVLENVAQKTLRPVFVECDRDVNAFDKVQRYTEYYQSKAWCGLWWAKKDSEGVYTFPRVLVVTERPGRVSDAIKKDNTEGLRFSVATVEQIKKDIYAYL